MTEGDVIPEDQEVYVSNESGVGTGALSARMARVLGQVKRVRKSGKAPAAMGGFMFSKEPDIYDAVRDFLSKEGIATTFDATDAVVEQCGTGNSGKPIWMVKANCRLVFHAAGETMESSLPMYAIDHGDKGAQKLASNAEKYLVMKTFLISTGEDDAEAHDVESDFKPAAQGTSNGAPKASARGVEVRLKPHEEPNELQQAYLSNLGAKKLNDGSYLATVPRKRANEMVESVKWAEVSLPSETPAPAATAKRGTPSKVK